MASKTYCAVPESLKIGYGTEDVSLGTQKKSTKIIEFVEKEYTTSDEDEQAFLEGAQFSTQIYIKPEVTT
jgi:hypothetical protein